MPMNAPEWQASNISTLVPFTAERMLSSVCAVRAYSLSPSDNSSAAWLLGVPLGYTP